MTCHNQLEVGQKKLRNSVGVWTLKINKMGCFNDPAWKVCVVWLGWVADIDYLYPARWGWININKLGCAWLHLNSLFRFKTQSIHHSNMLR